MSTILEKWLCLGCRFLLGYVEDRLRLRVKRKDLYIEIEEAKSVTMNCPRCGKTNKLLDEKLTEVNLTEKGGN